MKFLLIIILLAEVIVSFSKFFLKIALHAQVSPSSGKIVGSVVTTDGLATAFLRRPEIINVTVFYPQTLEGFFTASWDLLIIEGWFPSIDNFILTARTYNPLIKVFFFCLDPDFPSLDVIKSLDVDAYLTNSKFLAGFEGFPGLNQLVQTEFIRLAADPVTMSPVSTSYINKPYLAVYVGAGGAMPKVKPKLLSMLIGAADLGEKDGKGNGLLIYGANWEEIPSLIPYWKGSLPRGQLSQAYSQAEVVLASTIDKQRVVGMINNRIFEALSTGNIVISEPSQAIHELFSGLVLFAEDAEDVQCLLTPLLNHTHTHTTHSHSFPSSSSASIRPLSSHSQFSPEAHRRASREAILRAHSWDHRVIQILQLYRSLSPASFSPPLSPSSLPSPNHSPISHPSLKPRQEIQEDPSPSLPSPSLPLPVPPLSSLMNSGMTAKPEGDISSLPNFQDRSIDLDSIPDHYSIPSPTSTSSSSSSSSHSFPRFSPISTSSSSFSPSSFCLIHSPQLSSRSRPKPLLWSVSQHLQTHSDYQHVLRPSLLLRQFAKNRFFVVEMSERRVLEILAPLVWQSINAISISSPTPTPSPSPSGNSLEGEAPSFSLLFQDGLVTIQARKVKGEIFGFCRRIWREVQNEIDLENNKGTTQLQQPFSSPPFEPSHNEKNSELIYSRTLLSFFHESPRLFEICFYPISSSSSSSSSTTSFSSSTSSSSSSSSSSSALPLFSSLTSMKNIKQSKKFLSLFHGLFFISEPFSDLDLFLRFLPRSLSVPLSSSIVSNPQSIYNFQLSPSPTPPPPLKRVELDEKIEVEEEEEEVEGIAGETSTDIRRAGVGRTLQRRALYMLGWDEHLFSLARASPLLNHSSSPIEMQTINHLDTLWFRSRFEVQLMEQQGISLPSLRLQHYFGFSDFSPFRPIHSCDSEFLSPPPPPAHPQVPDPSPSTSRPSLPSNIIVCFSASMGECSEKNIQYYFPSSITPLSSPSPSPSPSPSSFNYSLLLIGGELEDWLGGQEQGKDGALKDFTSFYYSQLPKLKQERSKQWQVSSSSTSSPSPHPSLLSLSFATGRLPFTSHLKSSSLLGAIEMGSIPSQEPHQGGGGGGGGGGWGMSRGAGIDSLLACRCQAAANSHRSLRVREEGGGWPPEEPDGSFGCSVYLFSSPSPSPPTSSSSSTSTLPPVTTTQDVLWPVVLASQLNLRIYLLQPHTHLLSLFSSELSHEEGGAQDWTAPHLTRAYREGVSRLFGMGTSISRVSALRIHPFQEKPLKSCQALSSQRKGEGEEEVGGGQSPSISLGCHYLDSLSGSVYFRVYQLTFEHFILGRDGEACVLLNGRLLSCLLVGYRYLVLEATHDWLFYNSIVQLQLRGTMAQNAIFSIELETFPPPTQGTNIRNLGIEINTDSESIFQIKITE